MKDRSDQFQSDTRTSEPALRVPRVATPDSPTRPRPRDRERYQILGEHGRGGLGRVSRAHDCELGRDVAIKELISRNDAREARFLREALITARLEHPGIVPVHEAGRWPDGTPFYAMKLVAGRSLRELIAERSLLDDRLALLHHVIAVADAIAYAHRRNIIHRDLKPGNIIVGDFGETVVIDWGIAKDLAAAEEPALDAGPLRTVPIDDLTSAGTILGTPAYMAPEQERGEPVDQRADVFAIGAMLWELCAGQRVPPDERERERTLRRAGIDRDLIAIINKAVESDARRRYRDAGALAADLKAFTAGARIAARSYSLYATLAHWTRRRRALALSITAAGVLAVVGSVVYVRAVATERDRADAALARAEAAQTALGAEHAELTLRLAELEIARDPSAAIDVLASYRGADRDRANQLRAEAIGRGVASLRAVPHTAGILWLAGMPDGAVVSLGLDGTITKTSRDGATSVLARDVAAKVPGQLAYAASRHLLAYLCNPAKLCVLDVLHGMRVPVATPHSDAPLFDVAFSADGSRLGLLSRARDLRIIDIAILDHATELLDINAPRAEGLLFIDPDTIALATDDGFELARVSAPTATRPALREPDSSLWDARASDHRLVFATTRGQAYLVDVDLRPDPRRDRRQDPLRVAARVTLCPDAVSGLKLIPTQQAVAFACKDGTVGTWGLADNAITHRARVDGHANGLEISADGDDAVVASDGGTATLIDLRSGIASPFKGHGFRLSALSPPTAEYPQLLSADIRGAIRAWPLPSRVARVAGSVPATVTSAAYSAGAGATLASTEWHALTAFTVADGARPIGPHEQNTAYLELAASGRRFASYGASGLVEIWSTSPIARLQVLDTHHGPLSHVAFIADSDDFLAAGKDGQLVRWNAAGEPALIHQFDQPIDHFVVAVTGAIVLATADGALWRADLLGGAVELRHRGAPITRLLALPDGVWVCAGYADGEVVAIDTRSWQLATLPHAADAIRDLAASADGRAIAIASSDGTVRAGALDPGAPPSAARWTTLTVQARKLALTRDGLVIAICADGAIRIYSLTHRSWLSLPLGTADLTRIALASDERTATVFDANARILSIDMESVRGLF